MRRRSLLPLLTLAALAAPGAAATGPSLTLIARDREPSEGAKAPSDEELAALREKVTAEPHDRGARLALVQGLRAAGRREEALAEAKAWRAIDAYHLVVVRLIGDLCVELGRTDEARRAYSAVVELLPTDAQAQRALASVEKQQGDLAGAYDRLIAAAALAPDDVRLSMELADVAHRLGKNDEARARFQAIVDDEHAAEAVRYPARQRLAQILAADRRAAAAAGNAAEADRLAKAIDALGVQGGVENDVKIFLTWDTDRSDVDLWVTTPSGEKVFYDHKKAATGEALFDDVTTGYGPESFTAPRARRGTYLVQVNYYGAGRSAFREARGEVVVVLHEGTAAEERHVLPYKLFDEKQTVTVAAIEVR